MSLFSWIKEYVVEPVVKFFEPAAEVVTEAVATALDVVGLDAWSLWVSDLVYSPGSIQNIGMGTDPGEVPWPWQDVSEDDVGVMAIGLIQETQADEIFLPGEGDNEDLPVAYDDEGEVNITPPVIEDVEPPVPETEFLEAGLPVVAVASLGAKSLTWILNFVISKWGVSRVAAGLAAAAGITLLGLDELGQTKSAVYLGSKLVGYSEGHVTGRLRAKALTGVAFRVVRTVV